MRNLLFRLLGNESGASGIEYALVGTLISVAIIVGATAFGSKLVEAFLSVAGTM